MTIATIAKPTGPSRPIVYGIAALLTLGATNPALAQAIKRFADRTLSTETARDANNNRNANQRAPGPTGIIPYTTGAIAKALASQTNDSLMVMGVEHVHFQGLIPSVDTLRWGYLFNNNIISYRPATGRDTSYVMTISGEGDVVMGAFKPDTLWCAPDSSRYMLVTFNYDTASDANVLPVRWGSGWNDSLSVNNPALIVPGKWVVAELMTHNRDGTPADSQRIFRPFTLDYNGENLITIAYVDNNSGYDSTHSYYAMTETAHRVPFIPVSVQEPRGPLFLQAPSGIVYPNPARGGLVTVRFSQPAEADVAQIVSMNGIIVREIAGGAGKNVYQLGLQDLPAGAYYIQNGGQVAGAVIIQPAGQE